MTGKPCGARLAGLDRELGHFARGGRLDARLVERDAGFVGHAGHLARLRLGSLAVFRTGALARQRVLRPGGGGQLARRARLGFGVVAFLARDDAFGIHRPDALERDPGEPGARLRALPVGARGDDFLRPRPGLHLLAGRARRIARGFGLRDLGPHFRTVELEQQVAAGDALPQLHMDPADPSRHLRRHIDFLRLDLALDRIVDGLEGLVQAPSEQGENDDAGAAGKQAFGGRFCHDAYSFVRSTMCVAVRESAYRRSGSPLVASSLASAMT
jgi:hypothetical protein